MRSFVSLLLVSVIAVCLQSASGGLWEDAPANLPPCPDKDELCEKRKMAYVKCWQRHNISLLHFGLLNRCVSSKDLSESTWEFMRCVGTEQQQVLNADCSIARDAEEQSRQSYEADCATLEALHTSGHPRSELELKLCSDPMKKQIREAVAKCIEEGKSAWDKADNPNKCRNEIFTLQCCMVSQMVAMFQNP